MRRFGSAGYKNLKANTGKIRIDKSKFQNQRQDTDDQVYNIDYLKCAELVWRN